MPAARDVDGPTSLRHPVERCAPLGNGGGLKKTGMDRRGQAHLLTVCRDERRHREAVERRTFHFFAAAPPALRDQQLVDAERLEARDCAPNKCAKGLTLRDGTAGRRTADDLRSGEGGRGPGAGEHGRRQSPKELLAECAILCADRVLFG